MQDFIKMAAGQLGVSEETSSSATKGVLGMLKSNMDGGDFGALAGALPGNIGALLGGGDAADKGEAGGGLGGALGGMLGGGGGGALGGALGGMLGGGGAAAGATGGGLGGALGGMLGGDSGGALAAAMQLASSGLGKEQAGQFVTLFLNHIKSEAGAEMLSKVLSAVPQLKALAAMVG